jgi:peptidoglycan hydrolase-like protein with peptidoglycan-binding domain
MFAARGVAAQGPVPAAKKTSTLKSTAHKSSTGATTSTKTGAKPAAAAQTTSRTAHRRVSTSSKPVASTRRATAPPPRQQTPTPDRYKEIQQALVDKGYFSGPVDGTWGTGSVDALKRFQRDQNLTEDGKIGSLSLIALGLGPKRAVLVDAAPEKPVQQ